MEIITPEEFAERMQWLANNEQLKDNKEYMHMVCRNCEACPYQYGHPFDAIWNTKS